jgi:hypothetical protein
MSWFLRLFAVVEVILFLKQLREQNENDSTDAYKIPEKRSPSSARSPDYTETGEQ